jgi:tRNA A-37 threonylcarbamoyl transferase component Bud32
MWKCLKCNQGFYSNAKIYNPYEYKPLALAIKKALYEKISALPKYLPCGHSASGIRHKKECNGEMYVAYLNDRKMIMCYKCRALTKYKKFIFKCTICGKRFRDDGCFEKYNNNNEIEKGIDNSRNLSKRTSSKGKSLISVEDKIKSSSNNSNDDTTVITSSKTFSVGNLNTIKLQYYSLHEKTNINIFNDNNNTNNNTNSQSSFQIPQESKSERNIPTLFNSNDENEQSINSSLITLNQKYSHEQQLPDEDIQIPSFDLNNYDNISQIGQGKLSKILCVKESDTLNFFALKKEITKTKFKHDKILNNISIQYKLSNISEHITKIYNINTTQEDEISILEELGINNFENEILSNKKIKNFYTEIHLIKILSQIINALEILHMNNYAHFNINPNNILLFNDNVYKLNDFGNIQRISQEHFSLTLDELLENKYISPQINLIIKRVSNRKNALINSKEINFLKEDIYSLGLTILSVLIPISEPIPMLNEFINVDGRVIRMDKYNKYIKDKVKKYLDFANGIVGEINKKFLYSERIEELLCGMLNLKEENRMSVKEIKEFIIENYMNEE